MNVDMMEQVLEWIRGHYFGKHRGLVEDNDDPTKRGRLKVRVPSVLGPLAVWAMPCVPYAGKGVGFYSLPDAGTGVWIEFEAGDPSFPIWTGCFWADDELPDQSSAALKIWKTSTVTLRIDDDAKEVVLSSSDGGSVGVTAEVALKAGDAARPARHTVTSSSVVSEVDAIKTEVTSASFSVNNGALEVI